MKGLVHPKGIATHGLRPTVLEAGKLRIRDCCSVHANMTFVKKKLTSGREGEVWSESTLGRNCLLLWNLMYPQILSFQCVYITINVIVYIMVLFKVFEVFRFCLSYSSPERQNQ